MLEATGLECARGGRVLFRGLSLALQPGGIARIAGANGSGKTSLLRILCGLMAPGAGTVRWQGEDIRRLREAYWDQIAYVGHLNGVKDDLTAAENVHIAAVIAGWSADHATVRAALGAFGLAGFDDLPARSLSQGQRRRVALARLHCAGATRLWILDEPFTALDARGVAALSSLIGAHLSRAGSVVFTTHQDIALPGTVDRLELAAAGHVH